MSDEHDNTQEGSLDMLLFAEEGLNIELMFQASDQAI